MRRTIDIAIRDDAAEFLRTTAHKQKVHVFSVILQALDIYRYIQRVREADGEVVILRADGARENLHF